MAASFYLRLARRMLKCSFPYRYTFDLTYRCNSRCRTCNIWKGKRASSSEIRLWEFRKILDGIRKDVLWLTLAGGEPTLRDDLDKFMVTAGAVCPNLGLLNVSVNGLSPARTERLFRSAMRGISKKVNVLATVSIDGYGTKNDSIRGVKGAWKKSSDTLRRLRRLEKEHKNLSVGIQATISRLNIKHMPAFLDRMPGCPVYLTFAHDSYLFQNRGKDLLKPGKEFDRLCDEIRKRHSQKGASGLASRIYMKLAMQHFRGGEMILPCTASRASLTVDPYTNVRVCVSMGFSLGNLRENGYDIRSLVEHERCRDIREVIDNAECCRCWMPCEAYPTILHNLPRAVKRYVRGK